MILSLPYIGFTVLPFTILSICQPRKALHLYMGLSLCWKVHRRHCVTWENRAKQKYARAVNYFDWQAHGFVITVLCYLFLLLPLRRAICPDATATACCFQGWPTCISIKFKLNRHTTRSIRRSILDLKITRRSQVPTVDIANGKQRIGTECDRRLLSPSESGIAEDTKTVIKNEGKKKQKKKRSGRIHYFCFVVVKRISA
jgi:hypothetical protein